ncbi:MAG: hypothetical protein AAFY99_14445 [Pseudomonadota bacterium]
MAFVGTAYAELLGGADIRQTVTGETLKMRRSGLTLRLTLAEDGTAMGRMGPVRQSGSWSVEGDQLCIDMPRRPSGAARCQTITRLSSTELYSSNGITLTIE